MPHNPYGASKLAAEHLLHYHALTGTIGVTIMRCFNIAGTVDSLPDTETTRIIPKALAVAAGTAEKLRINGDGSAIREFTHVADSWLPQHSGLAEMIRDGWQSMRDMTTLP